MNEWEENIKNKMAKLENNIHAVKMAIHIKGPSMETGRQTAKCYRGSQDWDSTR